MNKDLLRYLADLAIVRQQAGNVMNVSRGIVDQKTLHKVSARSGQLDKLFVDVLLSGRIPGSAVVEGSAIDESDYVDISQRLKEAKEEIARRDQQQTAPAPSPAQRQQTQAQAKPKPRRRPKKTEAKAERPPEEVEAFQKLLADAESEVAASTTVLAKKKTRKKTAKKATT